MRDISDSINDIEKIAHEILKDSKAYDIFPTPVQKIINYANLKLDTSDLLIRPDRSFLEKFGAKLYGTVTSAIDKIIGMIDLKEDVIYLDHSMNDGRKNFVQLHEVGHGVLPWQKYTFLLDDKHTINQDTKLEFEREASIYASASLFQLGRFDEEIKKYSLNIKTAMKLANQFGSSVHASLRRYVENNPKRCSLLVLEKSKDSKNIFPDIRNYFQSLSFTKEFGMLNWTDENMATMPFVNLYISGCKFRTDQPCNFNSLSFEFDYFDSCHNAFVLLRPKGEKIFSGRKIIVK